MSINKKKLEFEDPEELLEASYKTIDDVLNISDDNIKKRRKEIIIEANDIYKEYQKIKVIHL